MENFGGTEGNDRIIGSEGDNNLWGYGGSDRIDAGAGNDTVITGGGADTVNAGDGDDNIIASHEVALKGRYVLIRHREGAVINQGLSLQEVEVYAGGKNVALKAKVVTSADGTWGYSAEEKDHHKKENLVDGVMSETNMYGAGNVDGNSWVMIDLGQSYAIDKVVLVGRDAPCSSQSDDLKVFVGENDLSGYGGSLADLTKNATSVVDLAGSYGRDANRKAEIAATQFQGGVWLTGKTVDGGAGNDSVDYSVQAVAVGGLGVSADLSVTNAQTVQRLSGNGVVDTSVVDRLSNVENFGGTEGNDRITGSNQDNKLFGNAGNDDISALAGNDMINTGTGNDKVSAGDGDDVIWVAHQGKKARYVYIKQNANAINAMGFAEIEITNGDSNLALSAEIKTSNGSGDTSKKYLIDQNNRDDEAAWISNQKTGAWLQFDLGSLTDIDKVNVYGNANSSDYSMYLSAEDLTANGSKLSNAIYSAICQGLSANNANNEYSTEWTDAKIIDGGTGNDTVTYERNAIDQGYGIDADLSISKQTVRQMNRNQTDQLSNITNLYGTEGSDRIKGSAANNRLVGLNGNDTIYGCDGDDLIAIGQGASSVDGGNGDDTIFVTNYKIGGSAIDGGAGTNSWDFSKSEEQVDPITGNSSKRSVDNRGVYVDLNSNMQSSGSFMAGIKDGLFKAQNIQKIYGTEADDYFKTNTSGEALLVGSGGKDVFDLYGINNRVDGGWGSDTYNINLNKAVSNDNANAYTAVIADDMGKSTINLVTSDVNLVVTDTKSKFYFSQELTNNTYNGRVVISDVNNKYKIILQGITDFSKQIEKVTFTNTANKTKTTLTDFAKITSYMAGVSASQYLGNDFVGDAFWQNAKKYITVASI